MKSSPATFAAIDFETANYSPSSACAVGIVRVEGARIVARDHYFIRPPSQRFVFTGLHGIAWRHVCDAPTFKELYPIVEEKLARVDFVAAHNASFDRRVLAACCDAAGLGQPDTPSSAPFAWRGRSWGLSPPTCRMSATGCGSRFGITKRFRTRRPARE